MNNIPANQQVREILASDECDSWVFNSGQMQGQLHKEEVRRGFEGRNRHVTSLLGVPIDERLQEVYSRGFDVGVSGWPELQSGPTESPSLTALDMSDI